jgi:hypothetical protein
VGFGDSNGRKGEMKKAILFTLILNLLAGAASAGRAQPLFVIERNKNTNVLRYDAQISNEGKLIEEEPMIAYWIMLAEDGRRKELTWLEKEMAYGFDIEKDRSGEFYRITLVSYNKREIKVYQKGREVKAEVVINGKPSYFEKIYINSTKGWPLPKVNYIELHGRDIKTGERCYERIVP